MDSTQDQATDTKEGKKDNIQRRDILRALLDMEEDDRRVLLGRALLGVGEDEEIPRPLLRGILYVEQSDGSTEVIDLWEKVLTSEVWYKLWKEVLSVKDVSWGDSE